VPVLVKFDKPMDASTVTVNTAGTTCSDSIQITTAADNFATTCLQFSSLNATTRNSVFSAALAADLDPNSDYIIKIAGSITDFQGKTLGADATYPFKSGVPSGTEPRVVNVTSSGGFQPLDLTFTVTFSRQISAADVTAATNGDWCARFAFSMDNFISCQNINTFNTAGAPAYTIKYKQPPPGAYVFAVKKGIIDNFGIATIADYSVNYP
jgi:hypothetical protein